nr:hypothetical protein CFP56_78286 [Quercus suber]
MTDTEHCSSERVSQAAASYGTTKCAETNLRHPGVQQNLAQSLPGIKRRNPPHPIYRRTAITRPDSRTSARTRFSFETNRAAPAKGWNRAG